MRWHSSKEDAWGSNLVGAQVVVGKSTFFGVCTPERDAFVHAENSKKLQVQVFALLDTGKKVNFQKRSFRIQIFDNRYSSQ